MNPLDERDNILDQKGDGQPVDAAEDEVTKLREENDRLKKAAHNRDGFEVREGSRLRKLEQRLDELSGSGQAEDEDAAIYDPVVRDLKREVRQLRTFVADMAKEHDPELEELEPFMGKVQDDHPELLQLKDPQLRLRTIKALARDEKNAGEAETEADGGKRKRDTSRAFRETGGPAQSRLSQPPVGRLESLLDNAKTSDERSAIIDAWNRKYPEPAE